MGNWTLAIHQQQTTSEGPSFAIIQELRFVQRNKESYLHPDDAAQIVREHNTYNALVNALTELTDWSEVVHYNGENFPIIIAARAALALATKGA